MYEVVKTVNGYQITRMIGTKGHYHVTIKKTKFGEKCCMFKTIKAATAFCETLKG